MNRNRPRHDRVLAAAHAARHEYHSLLAIVDDGIKQADHVVLIGHWLDDVEFTILPQAQTAADDMFEARWLGLAETTIQQVMVLLNSVKGEADAIRRA